MKKILSIIIILLANICFGQKKYNQLYYGNAVIPKWNDNSSFSYKVNTKDGEKTFLIDPTTLSKTDITDNKEEKTNDSDKETKTSELLYIYDNNVYLKHGEEGIQLSFDGTNENKYTDMVYYSPDSVYAVVLKKKISKEREVVFVESSPKDQLQPLVHSNKYVKPGDELSIHLPILFNLKDKKQINVDLSPYTEQFFIRFIRWNPDSKSYVFEFNKRGHQTYQLVEVDALNAKSRVVIDETSKTFVYYTKLWRHFIENSDDILWISERDGWRHMYMFDGNANSVIKRQITKGQWVVREVLHVDDKTETIYFTASGLNKNENPYYVSLYKIGFNGQNLKEITKEDGNHIVSLSPDKKYFVDVYSSINKEHISNLRKLDDGSIIMELEKGDASKAYAAGWMHPQSFKTKGRDGKTDIWGNIYFPKDYNPDKKYPVVEYIYAGPHDSHVQHNFHVDTYYRASLTEKGYIVVQIDGMGTYNRSKAFHDICWQNLKDAGFPDRTIWIKAAAEKYPSIDIDRVGIYGVSAGGQNAMAALLFHGDFYKAAVASCGCHDNRMDKIWWNELWMGYPIGKHYSASSNVDNAHLLNGKLMLSVGEIDTNVDPASTMQVVNALVKAEKYFELLVLPGQGHTLGGEYGMSRLIDFFDRNLR